MDQRNCEVLTMDIEWPYACVCTYTYTCSGLRFEVLILSYVAKTIMGLILSEFGQGITRFILIYYFVMLTLTMDWNENFGIQKY